MLLLDRHDRCSFPFRSRDLSEGMDSRLGGLLLNGIS
jgi:hypothetical protein